MTKRFALLFLLLTTVVGLRAQTIVDLQRGGTVRAKTVEDYRLEQRMQERLEADSAAYRDCLKRAFNALHTDSLQQAETLFRRALKLLPTATGNGIVRHNLARISMARGDWRKAVEELTALLKAQPDDRAVRFDRATAYLELGNAGETLADCDALLSTVLSDEERKRALFLRGAANIEKRLYREARADLEEVLRMEPANLGAPLLIAGTYESDGQPQEALSRLNLYVNNHPESVDGLSMRAALEARLDMLEAARADYDEAVRLEPANPWLRVARAEVQIRLKRYASARLDLDESVRLGVARASLQHLYDKLR